MMTNISNLYTNRHPIGLYWVIAEEFPELYSRIKPTIIDYSAVYPDYRRFILTYLGIILQDYVVLLRDYIALQRDYAAL
jgi:hypothetical protein